MTRRAVLGSSGTAALGILAVSVGCGGGKVAPAGTTARTLGLSPTAGVTANSSGPASRPTTASAFYFPALTGDDWEPLNVSDNGWDDQKLGDVATYCGDHNSTSLLITQSGRILLEQYWNGAARRSATDVFSASKSVISLLIGIAADGKLLELDDPVATYLGAGWTNSPSTEAHITIRNLLTMTSGLTDKFEFESQPRAAWRYNTNAFQMLSRVIEHAANTTIDDWTNSKLGEPLGWHDASWRQRALLKLPDGTPQHGLQLSARDAARFGLMVLGGGRWSGKPVVPAPYLAEALMPSTTLNLSYGYLWWLNGQESALVPGSKTSRPGPLIPAAPMDLVAAMGALDQRIYVVPSRQWVIVRQGRQANPGEAGAEALSGFDTDFFTQLMAAAPK